MDNFEFEKENYYTGRKLDAKEKKPNFVARSLMKMGLGKTKDQANLWAIMLSIILFGVFFIVFLG